MKLAVVVAAAASVLALVAAGCGESDEPETTAAVEWADGVCAALKAWTGSLERLGDRFTDVSSLSRDSLEDGAGDAREATDTLVEDLRGLGTPETVSGDEARQAVDELVSTLEEDIAEIEDTIEDISGLAGLPSAVSSLTATFTSMAQAISSAVSTIESADVSGELESAFEQAAACDELTGSSR